MIEQIVNIDRMEHAVTLFGSFDENIELIKKHFGVDIIFRGDEIKVSGEPEQVLFAAKTIEGLLVLINKGEAITRQSVSYVMDMVKEGTEDKVLNLADDVVCITTKGRPIKARTLGQKRYVDAMRRSTVALGIGPAGTGKTFLAVAMAVRAFRNHEVNRIILTRPAVEAGEKLGFLPGDLQNKVDPYLRPLYDALFEMLGTDHYQKYMERGNIEIAPLAYMRGRTLDDSYIILDEAQNTTHEQMKMFLTRLGSNSKMVITGDITQIDLPDAGKSGLVEAAHVLKQVEGIEIVRFSEKDVVRHKLIQEIIIAYEKYYNEGRRGS